MRIEYFCFVVAALAALCGMSLGIAMGIGKDFTLTPVHAHLNLLGWVSMFLYGLYYRGRPNRPGRLAWFQVTAAAIGFPAMTGGLAFMLGVSNPENYPFGEPLIIVGSLLTIGSMLLFLTGLLRDAFRREPATADLTG